MWNNDFSKKHLASFKDFKDLMTKEDVMFGFNFYDKLEKEVEDNWNYPLPDTTSLKGHRCSQSPSSNPCLGYRFRRK